MVKCLYQNIDRNLLEHRKGPEYKTATYFKEPTKVYIDQKVSFSGTIFQIIKRSRDVHFTKQYKRKARRF